MRTGKVAALGKHYVGLRALKPAWERPVEVARVSQPAPNYHYKSQRPKNVVVQDDRDAGFADYSQRFRLIICGRLQLLSTLETGQLPLQITSVAPVLSALRTCDPMQVVLTGQFKLVWDHHARATAAMVTGLATPLLSLIL